MPVLRVNNYVEAYRQRALCKDIHELAGRPNKNATTEFVNRQILEAIQPTRSDVLVDIGCGDASLLKMADGRVLECIGIAGTPEESEIGNCPSHAALHCRYRAEPSVGVRQCLQDRLQWRPTSGPG